MRHKAVKFSALAAQHIGQNLRGRKIRIFRAGETKNHGGHSIRQIRVEFQRVGFDRRKIVSRARWQRCRRDFAENVFHLRENFFRLHVADDDEHGVVRHIPGVVKFTQVSIGGFIKGRSRAERIVRVGRTLEHGGEQLLVENIFGIGQILRDFLFDGPAFFFPKLVVGEQVAHPRGFEVQRHVKILGGRGEKILRDGLLRVGVVVAAHRGGRGGNLVGGQTGTAAKHHVFGGVRGAGKIGGTFVRADAIIHHRRDDGRECVGDDDDLQAVGQRGAQLVLIRGLRPARCGKEQGGGEN